MAPIACLSGRRSRKRFCVTPQNSSCACGTPIAELSGPPGGAARDGPAGGPDSLPIGAAKPQEAFCADESLLCLRHPDSRAIGATRWGAAGWHTASIGCVSGTRRGTLPPTLAPTLSQRERGPMAATPSIPLQHAAVSALVANADTCPNNRSCTRRARFPTQPPVRPAPTRSIER